MPLLRSPNGLTITNPLVLYRALLATKRIDPDPAQYRLAIQLQKLYYRLKDYSPEIEYSYKLNQLIRVIEESRGLSPKTLESDEGLKNAKSRGIFSSIKSQKQERDTLAVTKRLTDHESALNLQSPQGLLLYGEVGTGKSMLVDMLADCLPNQKKRRWHFNTFMLETFANLEQLRKKRLKSSKSLPNEKNPDEEYPLLWLARNLISTSPILFLDEFQLPDRAASKILSNLFTSFFHLGGVLIATSNRMPEELANASGVEFAAPPSSKVGLFGNRWGLLGPFSQSRKGEDKLSRNGDFAAFLEVLRARCEIWDMEGGRDWRRRGIEGDDETVQSGTKMEDTDQKEDVGFEGLEPMVLGNWGLGFEQSKNVKSQDNGKSAGSKKSIAQIPKHYFVQPSSSISRDVTFDINLKWETALLSAIPTLPRTLTATAEIPWECTSLQVYGRNLLIPRALSGVTYWTFSELCSTNLGPADYISLASTFHTLILTNVPILTLLQKNEARRFITLLDALYEARCKLLIQAEAGPDSIFFPEVRHLAQDPIDPTTAEGVYPETFSEIYQDRTAPFRPNISAYTPSASPPSYSSSTSPSPQTLRSILADEDSDFGPLHSAGRSPRGPSDGAPGAGNEIGQPNFTHTGAFTGEDERFAYKRACSRLWEMCGARWWAREEEGWWQPIAKEARRWEGGGGANEDLKIDSAVGSIRSGDDEGLFVHGASPFRVSVDPPPKIGWTHAWGMMRWGKKAGVWGRGVEGWKERKGGKEEDGEGDDGRGKG